jgi:hypothetical protein
MKTLMISDLAVSTELDSDAMATVSGGFSGYYSLPYYWGGPSYSYDASTKSESSTFNQELFQAQNVDIVAGVNNAFANVNPDIYVSQSGSNNINYK